MLGSNCNEVGIKQDLVYNRRTLMKAERAAACFLRRQAHADAFFELA
jgi:hypothetical protein